MMKYFFWIAFAVFLAASIPHVAYFFASFEPSTGPEGVWWWIVSYAIAISIDVTVYLLSWTAFQRYRRYRTPKAVWQHWLLIVMCTVFSWGVNWAYARQFHSGVMLQSAETVAPWLSSVFPFMASAFPLLGIVYTMMAETITETTAEERVEKLEQMKILSEIARQTQLPATTLRRALISGSRSNMSTVANLLAARNPREGTEVSEVVKEDTGATRAITGQFVALSDEKLVSKGSRSSAKVGGESNTDKLQVTMEALKANAELTDEELAELLSLKRPASARFWRLKALEILNAQENESKERESEQEEEEQRELIGSAVSANQIGWNGASTAVKR
ncbi:MAG: hypothetical protein J2P37_07160 [Ktedonobacteraceae bacterium]|nr:hypothetical protein [Ktedonobacteraceae bacterium]